MTETQFKTKVQRFLDEVGAWHVKFMGNQFTKAGVPDLLVCIRGQFWGIELKTDVGRVSDLQRLQLGKIEKAGGRAIILRPRDFDRFRKEVTDWIHSATAGLSSGKNVASPGI